jgi:hypothetical protein
VIGLTLVGVALLQGFGDPLSHGTSQCSIGIPPCKTIVLTRGADDFLRELIHFRIVMFLQGIFALRFHITTADLDGVQFVGTNAPEKNFLAASIGVV